MTLAEKTTRTTVRTPAPPRSIEGALKSWPKKMEYYASPKDWRDEVFYFLMVDRFSDAKEDTRTLLKCDVSTPQGVAAIQQLRGSNWSWQNWATSGASRFQGGTLKGVESKLDYLKELGVTAIWLSPLFKQRVEDNTYHGYGIQDFLEIDPRFGTSQDLIDLVNAAHALKIRVILDVIVNHSGCNWLYDPSAGDAFQPPYKPVGFYPLTWPRDASGQPMQGTSFQNDDFVWPKELQEKACYMCAGSGDLGAGSVSDDNAQCKRTDFCNLRKFNLAYLGNAQTRATLDSLAVAYQYWIALADIDGYRVDTFKHITFDQARDFCNAIKEYAESLGKEDFFIVAEVAGGSDNQGLYLDLTGRNLNACLDIGGMREVMCNVAKGLEDPNDFFGGYTFAERMGSHRNWGSQHLSVVNDHDHVWGKKVRYAQDASNDHQAVTAAALQFFGLGIPCLYYGTEQGLASGAELSERKWLPTQNADWLLRESMFGPEHPRSPGNAGVLGKFDTLPGFGPHGTSGKHVFNLNHPIFTRLRQMAACRKAYKPLRRGRQYRRNVSFLTYPFGFYGAGELLAWSRVFDDQELLVVVNTHGQQPRAGRVAVDGRLCTGAMTVICNTDPNAVQCKPGSKLSINAYADWRYVDIDTLGPSEVLVIANPSAIERANWMHPDNPSALPED